MVKVFEMGVVEPARALRAGSTGPRGRRLLAGRVRELQARSRLEGGEPEVRRRLPADVAADPDGPAELVSVAFERQVARVAAEVIGDVGARRLELVDVFGLGGILELGVVASDSGSVAVIEEEVARIEGVCHGFTFSGSVERARFEIRPTSLIPWSKTWIAPTNKKSAT